MWPRFPKRSGARRAPTASLAALGAALLLGGCMYSLTGGGLPPHVRTMYVEYYDNSTPHEILRGDVQREQQQELPRSLGVRLAPQTAADAVVRGKLTSYDEATVNIDPNTSPGGRITAEQRRVQITFDAEIYDVRNDAVIWTGTSISAIGNFGRGEDVNVGRERAVREIVQKIVEGAQSQW